MTARSNLTNTALIAGGLALLAAAGWMWFGDLITKTEIVLRPDDPKTVALGEKIYMEECASCHGSNLEGQPNWRQRLDNGRLPAPPHDASGHTWHHPETQLFELTKFGPAAVVGGGYESDMPGYADTLSDEEILAALSYIKSTWPEQVRQRHDLINGRRN